MAKLAGFNGIFSIDVPHGEKLFLLNKTKTNLFLLRFSEAMFL